MPTFLLPIVFLHFFYIAPLLALSGESRILPGFELEEWVARMAVLNCLGLLAFGVGLTWGSRSRRISVSDTWIVEPKRFFRVALPLLGLSVVLQAILYSSFGGVGGFSEAYEVRSDAFSGLGPVILLAEAAPALLFLLYLVWLQKKELKPKVGTLLLLFVGFLAVKMIFGGLRGSRANVIWALFWAVGVAHLWVRPLPRWVVPLGAVGVIVFAYYYGFYKGGGVEAVEVALSEGHSVAAESTGRSMQRVIEGDLARADIQALLLYRLSEGANGYTPALGRSYLGSVFLAVPRTIFSSRPPTKVYYGTEALYGPMAWQMGQRSSRQFGLAGEAMLNFYVFGVPFVFFGYGMLAGFLVRFACSLRSGDSRKLLVPLMCTVLVLLLTSDSDNVAVFLMKQAPIVIAVVLGSVRVRDRSEGAPSVCA